MAWEQNLESVSTKQTRIAELAKTTKGEAIYHLSHHINGEWLREAYHRTRKDGAVGTDKVTAASYSKDLESNVTKLEEMFKSGKYRAPPVRRVYIPKEKSGERRGLGIPTFEDKVLQRAVVMALEPVYEQEFLPCSYGFRPGRSAHGAVKDLCDTLYQYRSGTVIEFDIKRCFDSIPHHQIHSIIRQRITDGVIVRAIGKWLNAGVMENGTVSRSDQGCPQGAVISPLLMNVYLHEVLDLWFEKTVKPLLKSEGRLIRYADDGVLVFKERYDAERVFEVLIQRFEKYGLKLHPDKTKLIDFSTAKSKEKKERDTFSYLGFTWYWGKSRNGNYTVRLKTQASRMSRARMKIRAWCEANRHRPIREQAKVLRAKLQGHYQYYGVSFNSKSLEKIYHATSRIWRYWLSRRSNRGRVSFERFRKILERFPLPTPRIVHSLISH